VYQQLQKLLKKGSLKSFLMKYSDHFIVHQQADSSKWTFSLRGEPTGLGGSGRQEQVGAVQAASRPPDSGSLVAPEPMGLRGQGGASSSQPSELGGSDRQHIAAAAQAATSPPGSGAAQAALAPAQWLGGLRAQRVRSPAEEQAYQMERNRALREMEALAVQPVQALSVGSASVPKQHPPPPPPEPCSTSMSGAASAPGHPPPEPAREAARYAAARSNWGLPPVKLEEAAAPPRAGAPSTVREGSAPEGPGHWGHATDERGKLLGPPFQYKFWPSDGSADGAGGASAEHGARHGARHDRAPGHPPPEPCSTSVSGAASTPGPPPLGVCSTSVSGAASTPGHPPPEPCSTSASLSVGSASVPKQHPPPPPPAPPTGTGTTDDDVPERDDNGTEAQAPGAAASQPGEEGVAPAVAGEVLGHGDQLGPWADWAVYIFPEGPALVQRSRQRRLGRGDLVFVAGQDDAVMFLGLVQGDPDYSFLVLNVAGSSWSVLPSAVTTVAYVDGHNSIDLGPPAAAVGGGSLGAPVAEVLGDAQGGGLAAAPPAAGTVGSWRWLS